MRNRLTTPPAAVQGQDSLKYSGGGIVLPRDRPSWTAAFLAAGLSPSTAAAYVGELAKFARSCRLDLAEALPAGPGDAEPFLEEARRSGGGAAARRAACALRAAHALAGLPDPCGSRAARVAASERADMPLDVDQLLKAVAACGDSLLGSRDAAMLLLGFAAGLGREEIANLAAADVAEVGKGSVEVRLASGGTRLVHKERSAMACPVRALGRWRSRAGAASGPVFRRIVPGPGGRWAAGGGMTGRSVARALARRLAAAGAADAARRAGCLAAGRAAAAAACVPDAFSILGAFHPRAH
jgi:site-specific recombinase XerD